MASFWLLESPGEGWLSGINGSHTWTHHAEEAISFTDKHSAEVAMRLMSCGMNVRPTEHVWIAPALFCRPPPHRSHAMSDLNYSEMSREQLERHAARLAQVIKDDKARQFWLRHALPPKLAPSCLVCGKLPEKVALWHGDLPGIVVCEKCRNAALAAEQETAALRADVHRPRYFNAPDHNAEPGDAGMSKNEVRIRNPWVDKSGQWWASIDDGCTYPNCDCTQPEDAGCGKPRDAGTPMPLNFKIVGDDFTPLDKQVMQLPPLTEVMYHAVRGMEYEFSLGGPESVTGYIDDNMLDDIWEQINTALRCARVST